jgi:hypothetical protein
MINIAKSLETSLKTKADLKYKGIYFCKIFVKSIGGGCFMASNSCYRFILLLGKEMLGHRKIPACLDSQVVGNQLCLVKYPLHSKFPLMS